MIERQNHRHWAIFFAREVLGFIISLGFVLIIVTFGHLLKEPLYPFHEHVIPRLALLLFVLLLPAEDDRFSLDYLLAHRRRAA